jgi:predicted ester cyclase
MTRWSAKGTHRGDLAGIPPTGKPVSVTGISIDRIAGGKIVETWGIFDQFGMLQQLGAIPAQG